MRFPGQQKMRWFPVLRKTTLFPVYFYLDNEFVTVSAWLKPTQELRDSFRFKHYLLIVRMLEVRNILCFPFIASILYPLAWMFKKAMFLCSVEENHFKLRCHVYQPNQVFVSSYIWTGVQFSVDCSVITHSLSFAVCRGKPLQNTKQRTAKMMNLLSIQSWRMKFLMRYQSMLFRNWLFLLLMLTKSFLPQLSSWSFTFPIRSEQSPQQEVSCILSFNALFSLKMCKCRLVLLSL